MTEVVIAAVVAAIAVYCFLLPTLERLPRYIGWEEEEIGVASRSTRIPFFRYGFAALTAGMMGWVVAKYGLGIPSLLVGSLVLTTLSIAWIDLAEHLVPECMSIPLLCLGLLASPFCPDVVDRGIGLMVGGSLIWGLMEIMSRVKGQQLQAGGDVVLAAICGAWFGFPNVLFALFCAASIFTIMAYANQVLAKEEGFPMGPAFACAIVGLAVINWWPTFA